MNPETPIQELPLKAVELLRAIISKLRIDPGKQPQEFILVLHSKLICQLGEEVVFLESHGYRAASPAIARAVYESLFKLGLALENPCLAAEKALREIEWSAVQQKFPGADPKKLHEIRKKADYRSIAETVSSLGKRWKLAREQIESDKLHSTHWCAREAKMLPIYQRQYAELSAFAHASTDTFIQRLFNITTGQVLVYVTYALLLAATKIVKKYHHQLPDGLVAKVQEFDQLFRSYDKAGHIKIFLLEELTKARATKPNPPEKKFEKN